MDTGLLLVRIGFGVESDTDVKVAGAIAFFVGKDHAVIAHAFLLNDESVMRFIVVISAVFDNDGGDGCAYEGGQVPEHWVGLSH
jgi:hypothetical protein